MKRLCLAVAFLLATVIPAMAQLQSGSIYGTVKDDQGAVLPGSQITLTGVDRTLTFTTGDDGQFRFLGLAPGRYTLAAELQGFTKLIREDILVIVGSEYEVPVSLKVAAVAETITVSGETPVVDTKNTSTSTNFTQDELARIPTSRDPWALLRTVPGVVVDRVNIAGNETGQQSNFASKGTNRNDAVWTLDGVVVTDMAAIGASPTYFDYDTFDEIQVSTAGQDIKQPTGGAGLNFVVKRGTNQFKGSVKGYYTNDSLEAQNVPDSLAAIGITPETADHNDQISEFGFDLGGPIVRNKAWVWGSWAKQDIRLVRQSANLIDQTILKSSNIKGNWQATRSDMISVLWFLGAKQKFGRATNDVGSGREASTATWNQDNFYPEGRPHGLLKFENNHVFSSRLFLASKYAYYGTGFILDPRGGLDGQSTISQQRQETLGTTRVQRFLRPQHMVNLDANYFMNTGGASHDFKFGFGFRRHDAFTQLLYPGDLVQGRENTASDHRARLWREGRGENRTEYVSLYIGDTLTLDRLTVNAGIRYDRQTGKAMPSNTLPNGAFPNLVPGVEFAGYDAPFKWNDVMPRIGVTYALDETRKTLLRANFSRYPSQLDTGLVGFSNLSGNAGWLEYRWEDSNGDRFVQPNEVKTNEPLLAFGGGFNPATPTSVTSADIIDPDLVSPKTTSAVIGIDRELAPNLAVQVNYTFTRNTGLTGPNAFGDGIAFAFAPWRGLTLDDYIAGPVLTGTLPDGSSYSVPTFQPNPARVAANGNGRILTNFDAFSTRYHGIEVGVVKRLADRWMMRAAFSYNDATEHFDGTPVNSLGNPTRRDTDPLVEGGQWASRTGGSGVGDAFLNAKWQVNLNGLYQLGGGFDVAANVFGRQGAPFPIFRVQSLGLDGSSRILISPEVDTFRFDDIWNVDLRISKAIRYSRLDMQLSADLFNVFNSNVTLNQQRNSLATNAQGRSTFQDITQNLSPRILRFGVRIGF